MANTGPRLELLCRVQGDLNASVIKSHLESEGIPVLLQYESLGRVYGLTVDGLAEVRVLVPADRVEEARRIIEPAEDDSAPGEFESPGAEL